MPRYKRNVTEAELDVSPLEDPKPSDPAENEVLTTLRNMWEFASLMQYIYLFGTVVKINEDFDIEDLEHECLQTTPSDVLASIGLALLKYVSSHRGLTPEIFTEYTRRQYMAKLPAHNPFGDDEDPIPFNELDIYTRIRVLQQLSTWTFTNSERIRGLMPEDEDDMSWRMEPLGWDADDRAYFVLDDNRLYRRTDEPLPPTPQPTPKSKSAPKKRKPAVQKSRGTRASKRRKIEDSSDAEPEEETEAMGTAKDTMMTNGDDVTKHTEEESGYGFTSKTWECMAITLAEYQDFLATIQRSRDPNEKQLRRRIEEEVLPIIEKRAEAIRQKQLKKLRELENLQKMATAKRSSRLADKADKQAKEEEERQVELKKLAELRMAHEEQEKQRRIEEGHESRRLTREQRLKEREVKRILHEEELARLERETSAAVSQQDGVEAADSAERKRLSSRNLLNQQEAHRKELERLTQDQEEDKWYFDCVVCGMHGENLDDGSHSVACERCSVWQHSNCHGFTPEQCENESFHFICNSCRRKEKVAAQQKSGIVLKLGKQNGSPSSIKHEADDTIVVAPRKQESTLPDFVQRQLDGLAQQRPAPSQIDVAQPASIQRHQSQQLPQQHHAAHQLPQQYQPPRQSPLQHAPNLAPNAARPPIYQHQSQPMQSAQLPMYTPRGFAGTPPQRTQQVAHPMHAGGHLNQGVAQHNWAHYSAVNGAHAQMPQPQPPVQPQAPMQPRVQSGLPAAHPQQVSHASQNIYMQQSQRPPSREHMTAGSPQLVHRSPQMPTPANRSIVSPQRTPQTQHVASSAEGALPSSPHTSFPPPAAEYNRQSAISPTKSSPPRPVAPSPNTHMLNGHTAGSFSAMTNHTASPSTSFEHAPKLATPSKAIDVSVSPSQNTSEVAANGMKGPWPNESLSVPHKNDSPAGTQPR